MRANSILSLDAPKPFGSIPDAPGFPPRSDANLALSLSLLVPRISFSHCGGRRDFFLAERDDDGAFRKLVCVMASPLVGWLVGWLVHRAPIQEERGTSFHKNDLVWRKKDIRKMRKPKAKGLFRLYLAKEEKLLQVCLI